MVLSAQEAQEALVHIVRNVLTGIPPPTGQPNRIEDALTLAGIDTIHDFLTMDKAMIDGLTYQEQGQDVKLHLGRRKIIEVFFDYVRWRNSENNPIGDEWMNVTKDLFNTFRASPEYMESRAATGLIGTTRGGTVPQASSSGNAAGTTGTTNPSPRSSYTPEELFRRGIKRDPNLFPILKDERFNDNWHRTFKNQARAQDLMEVLDPNYKPQTQEEKDLFTRKQAFMYAVLEATVKTDNGKDIVRKQEDTFDAQRVYKELSDHHLTSTKAILDSSNILSYITSARLGNGEWKGTTAAFIIHWQNQVRLYERQIDATDHFSDTQKKVMLENCVQPIPELRQVKTNADIERAKTGTALTYAQYVSLLQAAATSFDESTKTNRPRQTRRSVYMHEMDVFEDACGFYTHDEDTYDIDSPVSVIQANATQRLPPRRSPHNRNPTDQPRTRMTGKQWASLTDSGRHTWDTLSEQDKAVILGTAPPRDRTPQMRQVRMHETDADPPQDGPDEDNFHDAQGDLLEEDSDTRLINAAVTGRALPPGDIRRIMSTNSTRHSTNGTRQVNMSVTYRVTKHDTRTVGSLVDRGANGGVAGNDVRVIDRQSRTVAIQGIDNHQLNDIGIGTVGGVVPTHLGDVIAIMPQYALFGKGHSIHSPLQLEAHGMDVNDKSIRINGGLQRIRTPEGYVIPLNITNGLARLSIRPFTNHEWDTLPHVMLTAPPGDGEHKAWNPAIFDHHMDDFEEWFDAVSTVEELPPDVGNDRFDAMGNHRHRVEVNRAEHFFDPLDSTIDHCIQYSVFENQMHLRSGRKLGDIDIHTPTHAADSVTAKKAPVAVSTKEPDYSSLRPYFGWFSPNRIKHTFRCTTQHARLPQGTLLKRTFKSPNPALNVPRRSEPVACDIVYSDTPAIDNGSTAAVIFYGTQTHVTDVYGIKTDKQFINTLEDNIRERGAPTKLVSDRAQVEISTKVLDILRTLFVKSWQSEPHQQQQNPAERRYQTVKNATNRLMDRVGAPAFTWLLALHYVCLLLNYMYDDVIKNVPLTALLGSTVDISAFLRFYFWQEVYYKLADSGFPSSSTEGKGHIVGISEHVGHALTYMILTDDTQKIIYRSLVRPVNAVDANHRPATDEEETPPPEPEPPPTKFIKSRNEAGEFINSIPDSLDAPISPPQPDPTPVFNPEDLIGRTFLMDPKADGQKFRATITDLLEDHESKLEDNPTRIKFKCTYDKDQQEEVFTYNKVLDYISRDEESDIVWKYKGIVSHQGPLTKEHPDYNGSSYNVMVEWENGEITAEPLKVLAADDPVSCAIYAKNNGLLNEPGWKQFKGIAKRQKKFVRMVNQAKLRSFNNAPRYKYGFEVPRDYRHAMRLDERHGNHKWADAINLEFGQVDDYETFEDYGHKDLKKAPDGYKKIRVHLVFDVKHDGRHKARLVADGHLTDAPVESVYSGVVSIRGLRIVLFLAELNDLEVWSTDVGNAYLEAETNEKVYIIAGPEFGSRRDHILIIRKALYGLKTSGARWHDRFADCLRELGFFPCKAEPDIWIRQNGNLYEYVAVYVDDLALAMKDPKEFTDLLATKYKFKLKGTGPISFHLGMDFFRDEDGTLCMAPRKYIDKLLNVYQQMFGGPPKQTMQSPLEKGDHPELDTSDFLEPEDVTKYQSLIGALQWAITIGRFDIATAVMTMSSFRAAPRKGHMDRVKRICGYLAKMKGATIRIRTEEPDYSDIPEFEFDWSTSVYGDPKEEIPKDAPTPLGKHVTLSHFVDANLLHDLISGKSVTGTLHLMNKTPIDWYSKKQATVETATYGSEFVAARTCVEQIIDLRLTLRYLGVPIREKSHLFGDNKSVVDSSMTVHAKLHKRHTMLSFHRVREAVASKMLKFVHIGGEINPADILSKHWAYSAVWTQLKALLFHRGDTAEIE